jgi:hypothetical protein
MLSIRIVSAGAIAVIAVALAVSGATAQTATGDQPGQPLALLAGLRPPHPAKTHEAKVHAIKTREAKAHEVKTSVHAARTASRKSSAKSAIEFAGRTHDTVAAMPPEDPPVQTATAAPPANAWPVADATPPGADPTPAADGAVAAPPSAPPDGGLTPSALVVDGQTVQVTSPDEVNEIDLAADNNKAAPSTSHVAFAAPVQEDASQNANKVGSASWIAQVLAALGGAVAAGSVAWFLIGSGPVRTYG